MNAVIISQENLFDFASYLFVTQRDFYSYSSLSQSCSQMYFCSISKSLFLSYQSPDQHFVAEFDVKKIKEQTHQSNHAQQHSLIWKNCQIWPVSLLVPLVLVALLLVYLSMFLWLLSLHKQQLYWQNFSQQLIQLAASN